MATKINTLDQRNSIRIALVGCISSGKSTLLNAICVNQYEDMKRKKTTMIPTVYKGSNRTIYRNKDEMCRIKSKNKELNDKFYSSDSSVVITKETCELHENIIPMIDNFIDLPEGIFVDIYDIPGLNDTATKDLYYQWVKDNFHEFDIIINVCSIESGLNTTDEGDILNLITECLKHEKTVNNRDILFITAINKCDEMEIIDDIPTLIDEEDLELHKQIINTTHAVIKEKTDIDPSSEFVRFVPITARDTFIYRMLWNDPDVELDMSLLNKFGQNELGKKKWTRYTNDEKRAYIKSYFYDKTLDIVDILQESGYIHFKDQLNYYLSSYRQSVILVSRLKLELQKEELLNKNITKDVNEIKELINIYNNYSIKVSTIDHIYKTDNSGLITDLINNHMTRWINEISDLSNDKNESIERLEEYKQVMMILKNNIQGTSLRNKINVIIPEGKDKRWSDSLGIDIKDTTTPLRSTLSKLFSHLYKGYSTLQNEYYHNQLKDVSKMNNFPHDMFSIIDKLKDNRFDNIEGLLDDMIKMVTHGITPGSSGYTSFTELQNGPLSNYIPDGLNSIKTFCELLMDKYDYPKSKIIDFLKYYLMNIYSIYKNGSLDKWLSDNLLMNLEKSYCILLHEYLDKLVFYHYFFENLKIINKSYANTHSINLDPTINYVTHRNIVLVLPTYLVKLISNDQPIVELDTSDEYS